MAASAGQFGNLYAYYGRQFTYNGPKPVPLETIFMTSTEQGNYVTAPIGTFFSVSNGHQQFGPPNYGVSQVSNPVGNPQNQPTIVAEFVLEVDTWTDGDASAQGTATAN